jgi:hypothetical protein
MNVMLTAVLYGYMPSARIWQTWERYYAFRNPSRTHFQLNTGFIRLPGLDSTDTGQFVRILSMAERDGISRAGWSARDGRVSDHSVLLAEAASRVSPALLHRIIQLGTGGQLGWTTYRDGDVNVWRD